MSQQEIKHCTHKHCGTTRDDSAVYNEQYLKLKAVMIGETQQPKNAFMV